MNDHRLVLFDIDGTLLHSGGCGRAASRLAMQDIFGTIGLFDDVSLAGNTDWQMLLEALTPVGITTDQIQASLHDYGQAASRRLTEIIADFLVRPCTGVPALIEVLKANPNVLLGLVTGNMDALVPIKLRAAGYDPGDFVVGAYGSEGHRRDMLPPLALERARRHRGANFEPEQIVIIGDTPGDITCAASIQARTIAVATGPFDLAELRTYRPTHAFETLADRAAVLAAILHDGHA
jgi:phosphoglycolate phosphatase